MAECPHFEHLLVIPHLWVQNANSLSSPLTHGFPSITAFLGLMWALERKTHAAGLDLQFNAVSVVAHHHEEQVTHGDFVNTLRLTRNPLNRDGSTAAIVEEGRIHLQISLVFAVQSQALSDQGDGRLIAQQVRELLMQMRIAGGSVLPSSAPHRKQQPYAIPMTGDEEARERLFYETKLRLLPGFVLVERQDLLRQRHQDLQASQPQATLLDAWLLLSRINWSSVTPASECESPRHTEWTNDRKGLGWIVPIPLGYGALTPLQAAGSVARARDAQTPFRFVESLYGVGQWISPHRLQSVQQLLWYADYQSDEGLYRCRNDYRAQSMSHFD
ncbi:type I-F CRISPR-associated protein Csy2 [Pseudomonas sp. Eqa60]|uniref:type I-F CRISPR-associated protein Csy2 n=1 Tax=unclassified Pseudomonas TaxID=196821 RepID=UPI001BB42312|nr:type I-F CRISPR-associated protein Csy2 [Pseudomonas sp. Eqa60]BCQ66907.1 type I-F CRISPR-associated protein Csy2 [Pseudomonas sp. Eqa60]